MSSLRARTDEELLALDADPANEAFAAFYERYEGVVLAYFLRRVRLPEVAADLASETFAEALASRHRFRRRRGAAAAWLFGIAHHGSAAHTADPPGPVGATAPPTVTSRRRSPPKVTFCRDKRHYLTLSPPARPGGRGSR